MLSSAFISGSEVAYFSLSPSDHEKLVEKKGKSHSLALKLLSKPERLLSTILVANNALNIAIIILAAYISSRLFDFSNPVLAFIIEVVVITFILLLFCEIMPKVYASRKQLRITLMMAPALSVFVRVFSPLASLLMLSSFFVRKKGSMRSKNISMTDLSDALDLTSGEIKDDKNILKGIVRFGNISVNAVMCPRIDVTALDIRKGFMEILAEVIESGFSRIPVYSGSFDNVKGVLFVKDLLPYLGKPDSFKWQSLIRPPYVVPETKKINELLKEFQEKKIHMAIVVDEYGGSSGIVTLEDILEEIVGDIIDETDEDIQMFRATDDGGWIFDGKILINDFYRITGTNDEPFDEMVGESETLAGLLLEHLGEIPQKGQVISLGEFTFTIELVEKRRIREIRAIKGEVAG
ncbi:MAG: gliding motility-associated protein GldE [Bacteroidia bacterium]|nr:MAG: gliding motility-associated protein GldE [Bacteroidia bacterium]